MVTGDTGAEFTTDDLVEDLVHQEDDDCGQEKEPAEAEEDECEEIEKAVTVVVLLRVGPLDVVDGVVVSERSPEVVKTLPAEDGVERFGPHHVPGHPPGHGDHPEDYQDNHHDVVHQVAAKLTETASHLNTGL